MGVGFGEEGLFVEIFLFTEGKDFFLGLLVLLWFLFVFFIILFSSPKEDSITDFNCSQIKMAIGNIIRLN